MAWHVSWSRANPETILYEEQRAEEMWMSENKVGKWQLHSEVVLGKQVLKVSFCLIILMHDPTSLVLSSNDSSICNMFAVLD